MNWVVEIQFPTKHPFWVGTISASNRNDAKRAARLFVSAHFPLDAKILRIARGSIKLTFEGNPIPFDDEIVSEQDAEV